MKRNGPRGVSVDDIITMKAQIITTDMVAADAAGCKLFGIDPASVKYIAMAEQLGVGTADLDKLNISRIKV